MSVQPAEGRKDDYGKPRIDLIPAYILLLLGNVLAYGAKRYGDTNWKNVPNARDRYYSSAQRHLLLAERRASRLRRRWQRPVAPHPRHGMPHVPSVVRPRP